ncbi:Helicase domain protein [[Clostridium] ultunense Esp]|nr:Helicase domain protein [[Clostridium] ultunense Esp]
MYTPYHSKYYATLLTLKRPSNSMEKIASSLSGAKVDLNPHQIDAALFALRSPLSNGVLLADEVGLGKTIEAAIVIAQFWAEHKRRILLIVPASLRNQWLSELEEKFYIKSLILESKNYNQMKRNGILSPFETKDKVVICSYHFAAKMANEIASIPWDLVVMDEAHRLRNVYKPSNVIGNTLKMALSNRKKLLLTATPLQNSLMELYGLVSILDEHVFGDVKTYRDMYINVDNEEIRNIFLRQRLQKFCKRMLRKQVTEYVRYTRRISILQEYAPTKEEELLYNKVSEYLLTPKLYALPASQRKLMTLILRKLLASSSFAISGTLKSLIARLQSMLEGYEAELDLNDYDALPELAEEWEDEKNDDLAESLKDKKEISEELQRLTEYLELSQSIKFNSKGENLLTALQKGFEKAAELGAQRKAVIFTESQRTQDYLVNLLTNNGYGGQVVVLNGDNNDPNSNRIYREWLARHQGEEIISGSKQADMKAAIVEEFRERASILIGTEAAAEGINLQFCSLVVNYDLPWNPQRIEQRIGRCHRYGQKNDVVVINFLNIANEADKRVYQLLDEKFRLFDGIFGASDEVLGAIESGIDFEKRIAEIYQTCRTSEEIQAAFDEIQRELEEKIQANMAQARRVLLENFDEEVAGRLKTCENAAKETLSLYEKWLYKLVQSELYEEITLCPDEPRFYYNGNLAEKGYYHLNWKKAEQLNNYFLRKEHPLVEMIIQRSIERELPYASLTFDYTNSEHKITFFEEMKTKSGWLIADKLTSEAFEIQEHLLLTCVADDGTALDEELAAKLFELPVKVSAEITKVELKQELIDQRKKLKEELLERIRRHDLEYFREECDKLDAWADDLKQGLEREIKRIDREITQLRKEERMAVTLEQTLEIRKQMNMLEKRRREKIRDLYKEQDRIDEKREELQAKIERQLQGRSFTEELFIIRWILE